MASFPTAVKSFTSKNPGEVVQSAHVNDLQDEVNAIEAGYINGTAPLNSSRATPSALSVAGGSTLATLSVVSHSTVGGNLVVAGSVSVTGTALLNGSLSVPGDSTFGVRPVMPPPHAALVYIDSTVTIGSSGGSTLSWNSQDFLTNSSMHSTTTNPSRLTPQSTGIYQISAQVTYSPNSTGGRDFYILDSSAGFIARTLFSTSGLNPVLNITGYKRFDVTGSYAVAVVTQAGQTTLSLIPGVGLTWMAMVKL